MIRTAQNLPTYLADMQREVEGYAKEFGLDFFDTIFEVLDYQRMNEVAAYGGFPTRYPHWRFGMEFEGLAKGYEYGLSKIYEMVINNDPCYAYLLEGNSSVDQKMVMAHVYGHCDFFKNNYYFSKTNRRMIDGMANHSARVRKHIERQGLEKVELFIDYCLTLDNLIDPYSPYIMRRAKTSKDDKREDTGGIPKLRAKSYMDKFINPPDFVDSQKKKIQAEKDKEKRFPENPERDVLLFLIEHGPVEDWERDVLEVPRAERAWRGILCPSRKLTRQHRRIAEPAIFRQPLGQKERPDAHTDDRETSRLPIECHRISCYRVP